MPPKRTSAKRTAKKAVKKSAGSASIKSVGKKSGTKTRRPAQSGTGTASTIRASAGTARRRTGVSAVEEKASEKLKSLRENLLRYRKRAIEEAKAEISRFIKGESRQIVDTALDEGDLSRIDISEDLNIRKLAAHKEKLNKIDEALRKLQEGTYGICEDCGDEISEERLKVIPFAIYCLECKEKREQLEEFQKEG